ncbi:hypothetical protein PL8927_50182 [Planktothrix serta PCC 8927]|uniref:Uncharacterized protein n=1 Tax=Planktothrix serta PCC 8927 TaxID=671068 RepID=A0A7Z9BNQ3_9CYAN|nr:hypothetical protein PL8927_50182 [Planktothrix serta PCC 8927]
MKLLFDAKMIRAKKSVEISYNPYQGLKPKRNFSHNLLGVFR